MPGLRGGGLWPDVRSGSSSRSPCPYGGWSQLWHPQPSAKPTPKADSGLPSRCHESYVLVPTRCLLTWLQPHLSPRQPWVIMGLHFALSWNPLPPSAPKPGCCRALGGPSACRAGLFRPGVCLQAARRRTNLSPRIFPHETRLPGKQPV